MRRLDEWISPGLIALILICAGAEFQVFGIPKIVTMIVFSLIVFLLLGWRIYRKKYSSEMLKKRVRFFVGSGVILFLMLVYCLNPTHRWEEGVGALPMDSIRFLPGAAFAPGAWAVLGVAAVVLAVLGLVMSLSRKEAGRLCVAIFTGGAVTSLVVLGQRLAPMDFPVFETTGFFAYENHFAAFANLILPVALFFAGREKIRAFQEGRVSSPAGVLLLVSAILFAAVMVSGSRAGIALAGLLTCFFAFWIIRFYRLNPFAFPPILRVAKIGCECCVVVISTSVLYLLINGFSSIGTEASFRWQVFRDTSSLWIVHPVWGTGPGSFSAVFPYYQDSSIEQHFFRHAHCDPLQFLAEYGVLGSGIVLGSLVLALTAGFGRRTGRSSSLFIQQFEKTGLVLALLGLALHSLVDFPFHHPLITLLAMVWVGILMPQLFVKKQKIRDE